ncbi:MAG: hypothetical protein LJF04_01230 [Gemmatimonadetes bacterium]|nr:hypothetical protein [Gemmatimonadota bacterium]
MNTWNALRPARASLHGVAALLLLALVASCDNDTTDPVTIVPLAPLLIVGGEMGAQSQNLTVTREGHGVTDATVTINGVAIPHVVAGLYHGQLPTALPAGSPLNLQVSAGGTTVQGTVNVPEAPVLTAPAAVTPFDPDHPDRGVVITVSWTSATNPDRFVVLMSDIGSRLDMTFPAAGTARELKIALPWPGPPGTTFSVFAYNDGSFTGEVDPDSRMSVGIESSPDAGITTDSVPLLILGDVGAQFEKLTVTRGGVAVTDATVTINGVAIPHAGAGLYQGPLPTAAPAGSPLDLQVSAGGSTVQGTVNVPEAPVLTAPLTEADIDAGGDSVTVTWTSATNPERFVASWIFDGVTVGKTFTASGTARELRIAARPANTKLPLGLAACNDGSFSGPVHPDSRMGICAQSLPNAASPLRVSGSVGAQSQDIWVFQGWDHVYGVNDAMVTVNGVTIPPTALPGYYHGELPAVVPPGSPLDLRVSARGLIVEATGDVPEVPVLTAPAAGAIFAPGASITFSWTSTTSPGRFMISVDGAHLYLPGTARELTIPTNGLPAGADITISVVAYNDRSFSGPVHPFSRMEITSVGNPRVITINH